MGYLNNQVVEIDAILTKKGRELLAKSPEAFNIAKFALADDEVDYRLWNTNHSLGTDYYGEVIENMPILEGSPNEDQMLKFKLITMNKDATYIPTISIGATYVELYRGQSYIVIPETINIPDGNSTLGYTAVLSDNTYLTLGVVPGYTVPIATSGGTSINVGDSGTVTAIGYRFKVTSKTAYYTGTQSATVTVTGNETGGRVTLNVTWTQFG
jgi:hypothetical protein